MRCCLYQTYLKTATSWRQRASKSYETIVPHLRGEIAELNRSKGLKFPDARAPESSLLLQDLVARAYPRAVFFLYTRLLFSDAGRKIQS
jgi:hypothetical protein